MEETPRALGFKQFVKQIRYCVVLKDETKYVHGDFNINVIVQNKLLKVFRFQQIKI